MKDLPPRECKLKALASIHSIAALHQRKPRAIPLKKKPEPPPSPPTPVIDYCPDSPLQYLSLKQRLTQWDKEDSDAFYRGCRAMVESCVQTAKENKELEERLNGGKPPSISLLDYYYGCNSGLSLDSDLSESSDSGTDVEY